MPPRIHPDTPDISKEDQTKRIKHGPYSAVKMFLFSVQPIHPTLELDIEEPDDHSEEEN